MALWTRRQRDQLPEADFGDPANQKYPVRTQADLDHAARQLGRDATDSAAAVRRNLAKIAQRRGLKPPDAWAASDNAETGPDAQPTPAPRPASYSEGRLGTCSGVEVFAAGEHRGETYTRNDLDEMAENFNRFSRGPTALLKVPAVLGHEEDQELLERTDLPAAGWAKRCYRDGDVLKADFGEVPESIGRLINGRAYRKVSAEVYPEPPEGIPGKGKMLRRVALLGGEIPQIKSLADLPLVDYAEPPAARPAPVVLAFAESRPGTAGARVVSFAAGRSGKPAVDRFFAGQTSAGSTTDLGTGGTATSMTGANGHDPILTRTSPPMKPGKNCDPTAPRKMDDGIDMADRPAAPPAKPGKPGAADPGAADPGADDRDQLLTALQRAGFDTSVIDDSVSDDLLAEILRQLQDDGDDDDPQPPTNGQPAPGRGQAPPPGTQEMADPSAPQTTPVATVPTPAPGQIAPPPPFAPPTTPGAQFHPKEVSIKYAELAEVLKPLIAEAAKGIKAEIAGELKSTRGDVEKFKESTRQASVVAFVEAQRKAGRVLPCELDATGGQPTLYDRLMRADAGRVIAKFGEKEVTELDLQMAEISRRPVLAKFSELVREGAGGQGQADAELAEVRAFAEAHAEDLKKVEITVDKFAEGFTKAKKRNPKLTARDYTGA